MSMKNKVMLLLILSILVLTQFGMANQISINNSNSYIESSLPSHQPLNTDPTGQYIQGQVLVRYKTDVVTNPTSYDLATSTANRRIAPKSVKDIGSKSVPGIQSVELPSDVTVENAISIYTNDSNVLWAQPNYVYKLTTVPNDPLFDQQWWLNNTGQSFPGQPSGTIGDDIHIPAAWDTFTGPVGSNDVVVAVVDSGVDYTHPDLQDNLWTNPGETGIDSQGRDKRFNGIDDEVDGIIDDWRGFNMIDNNGNITDNSGHGTAMAGIIGAMGNNGIGVSGINWRVKIVPVRIFNDLGSADEEHIMSGMEHAVDYANAKIISNSWTSNEGFVSDNYIKNYIDSNPDVLFIFGAGNCNVTPNAEKCSCAISALRNNDNVDNPCRSYPASYDSANIISVASSDQNDNLSTSLNFPP
jgi:subtilisin family serine protease